MKLEAPESEEELGREIDSLRHEYDERTPEFWEKLRQAVWLFIRAEREK